MNFPLPPFTIKKNYTLPILKGIIWSRWLITEEKSCMNASITSLNVDNSILDGESNTYGMISIPMIEITFDNEYIHVLHDTGKWYIYWYLISNLISSEATIHNIIWQTICLLLIWGAIKGRKIKDKRAYNWAYRLLFISHKRLVIDFILKQWEPWPTHTLSMQSQCILLYNLSYVSLWNNIQNPRLRTL